MSRLKVGFGEPNVFFTPGNQGKWHDCVDDAKNEYRAQAAPVTRPAQPTRLQHDVEASCKFAGREARRLARASE